MAYRTAPPLAFPGYRLRVPGGPPGGQYHGYLGGAAEDFPPNAFPVTPFRAPGSSLDAWAIENWGGNMLSEGVSNSDYVYRSSAEMRPRANASGGASVVDADQAEITPGFAESPGNYRALGRFARFGAFTSQLQPGLRNSPGPGADFPTYQLPNRVASVPSGSPLNWPVNPATGATASTPQPPPPSSYAPVNTVQQWQPQGPQGSPAPSPSVPAYPSDYEPGQGQPLFSISPTTAALAPGQQTQFSASIPVTWSAIYGTITGTGLYTAPTGSSALADTVTATAINQSSSNRQGRAGIFASSGDSLQAQITILQAATLQAVAASAANDPNCLAIGATGGPYPNCTPAAAASIDFSAWLAESTVLPGVSNELVLFGGLGVGLVLFLMMRRR